MGGVGGICLKIVVNKRTSGDNTILCNDVALEGFVLVFGGRHTCI